MFASQHGAAQRRVLAARLLQLKLLDARPQDADNMKYIELSRQETPNSVGGQKGTAL